MILKIVFMLVIEFVNILPKNKHLELMTTNEFYIFLYVNFFTPVTMKDVANKLQISKSTVTLIVDKLEEKKLIKRIRSTNDRRKIFLAPSKKGIEVFKQITNDFSKLIDIVTNKIPEHDLKIINKGFEIFIKRLGVKI